MINLRDLGFNRLLDRPLDEDEIAESCLLRSLDRWGDRLVPRHDYAEHWWDRPCPVHR